MADLILNPLDTAPMQRGRSVPTFSPASAPQRRSQPAAEFQDFLPRGPQQKPTPLITPSALNNPKPVQKPADVPEVKTSFPQVELRAALPRDTFFSPRPEVSRGPAESVQQPLHQPLMNPRGEQQATEQSAREAETVIEFTIPAAKPIVEEAAPQPALSGSQKETTPPEPEPRSVQSVRESTEPVRDVSFATHVVQKGDTLSDIVASALRDEGIDFDTRSLYNTVRTVADANGLRDPNFIMVGQRIDLGAIRNQHFAHSSEPSRPVSFADGIQPPVQGRITSHFGQRIHPIRGVEHHHNGIDIAAPTGTPVTSVKPGIVTFQGEVSGYGQLVEIDHQDGTLSRYAHLSDISVHEGQHVLPADAIGAVGSTGMSTGPHLHLEIHRDGKPINPLQMIPEPLIAMR